MLKIDLITVGKLKEDYLTKACNEYAKRLSAYSKLNIIELPESKLPQDPSPSQIEECIENEGQAILAKIPTQTYVISMCIEGEMLSSPQLAQKLSAAAVQGASRIAFIIGGSWGLSDKVKQSSQLRLSMSRMTFPHQLARVMVLEQLYRACSINNNSKYHK